MQFNSLTSLLNGPVIFKIGFLFVMAIYIIFTFIVFNQIRSMNQIISETNSSVIIKLISLANIIVALLLFFAAVAIL